MVYLDVLKEEEAVVLPEVYGRVEAGRSGGLSRESVGHDQEVVSFHLKVCPVLCSYCYHCLVLHKLSLSLVPAKNW